MERAKGPCSQVAHRAHNPKVEGSNPSPATNKSVAVTHVTAFLEISSFVAFSSLTQRLTQASVIWDFLVTKFLRVLPA